MRTVISKKKVRNVQNLVHYLNITMRTFIWLIFKFKNARMQDFHLKTVKNFSDLIILMINPSFNFCEE